MSCQSDGRGQATEQRGQEAEATAPRSGGLPDLKWGAGDDMDKRGRRACAQCPEAGAVTWLTQSSESRLVKGALGTGEGRCPRAHGGRGRRPAATRVSLRHPGAERGLDRAGVQTPSPWPGAPCHWGVAFSQPWPGAPLENLCWAPSHWAQGWARARGSLPPPEPCSDHFRARLDLPACTWTR